MFNEFEEFEKARKEFEEKSIYFRGFNFDTLADNFAYAAELMSKAIAAIQSYAAKLEAEEEKAGPAQEEKKDGEV